MWRPSSDQRRFAIPRAVSVPGLNLKRTVWRTSGLQALAAAASLVLAVPLAWAQSPDSSPGAADVPRHSASPFDPLRSALLKDFSAHRSSSDSPDPNSNNDSKHVIPGETITLADLTGPGIVTHMWVTVADNEYGWPRLLRLRVYYDGSAQPSVDAPIGDFFAVGHGFERPVKSLMIRDSSDGRARNSYWPMPFARSCRITVTNEGRRYVDHVYYHVDWEKLPSLPPHTGYFHAWYRQELPAPADGKPYVFLDVKGRGFYAGTVFSVVQAQAAWFGEGDDHFYVDGEEKPSIEGTGSEDYFNDAWGLHVVDGDYTGVPVAEGEGLGSRMTAYRWHIVDPVPFTKSLHVEIEHKGWTYDKNGKVNATFGPRTDLMSSVAYWYQEGIATGLPPVPYGSARLPQGNARQIEVENSIGQARAERGKTSVARDLFWSKDVLLFQAEGPGAKLTIPFDVDETGQYELYTDVAQASNYGVYAVLLDGKAPVAPVLEHEPGADIRTHTEFDGYAPETYVGLDFQVGWPLLTKGPHNLTFVCVGKNAQSSGFDLGVDDVILARAGPEGWAMAAKVRPPRIPSDLAGLAAAMKDSDAVVRGLAARKLRNMGKAARRALPALTSALRDPNWVVRMAAAEAIAGMGSDAAPAVSALAAVCGVSDESVHVVRACAEALGAIGPAARPALPVLQKIAGQLMAYTGGIIELSSQWAARKAVERIEGR
jgi:D-arabinan exo alpha-(1,3)/(1,5)-arabinofuranosidase (non-reducing end)